MAKLLSGREEGWVSFNAKGLLPEYLLLQAVLLLPYVLCGSCSRYTKSQDHCWSPEHFWTHAEACAQLKIKHLLSKTAGCIFTVRLGQTVNIYYVIWNIQYLVKLCCKKKMWEIKVRFLVQLWGYRQSWKEDEKIFSQLFSYFNVCVLNFWVLMA